MLSPGSRHTPSGGFLDGTQGAHQEIFSLLTEGAFLEQLEEATTSIQREDILEILETTYPHLINETFITRLIQTDIALFIKKILDPDSPISQLPPETHRPIARTIAEAGYSYLLPYIFDELTGIRPDQQRALLNLLIQDDQVESIFQNGLFTKLTGIDPSHHFDLAKTIIYHGDTEVFSYNSFRFSGLESKFIQHAYLPTSEAIILEDQGSLTASPEEQYHILTTFHPDRQSPEIQTAFETGVQAFGYEKMWAYLKRSRITRHEQLKYFPKTIALMQQAQIKPSIFYNDILTQIQKDKSAYGDEDFEKNSYEQYNNILERLDDINKNSPWEKAQNYPEISALQDFVTQYDTLPKALSSRKVLNKFYETLDLLKDREFLTTLTTLSRSRPQLHDYTQTLLFHPGVAMSIVKEFLQEPEKFLARPDDRMTALHEIKKPSIYSRLHFELEPKDIRDALIDGTMDRISSRAPFEVEYEIADEETYNSLSMRELLLKAVGSRSQNIAGEAIHPNKLFSELQALCKKRGIQLLKILSWEQPLSADQESQIRSLTHNPHTGLPTINTEKYKVQIHRKSDPQGAVAGDDTASCMGFGRGKNNVYLRNPMCGIMTVQRLNKTGHRRTIAQSVLTKDKNIGTDIPTFVHGSFHGVPYQDFVSADILQQSGLDTIACDNIEISTNYYNSPKKDEHLTLLYSDFFAEYLKHYGEKDGLDPSHIIIGIQSRTGLPSLTQIPNTYWPRTPVAYSDNTKATTFSLAPQDYSQRMTHKTIHAPDHDTYPGMQQHFSTPGLSSLTHLDTLEATYVEAMSDKKKNGSLIIDLDTMSGFLITQSIANAQKDRPNLSIKYNDPSGNMLGHLMAYEKHYPDRKVILIISIAALHDDPKVIDALIHWLCELYKNLYIKKYHEALGDETDETNSTEAIIPPTIYFSSITGNSDEIGEKLVATMDDEKFQMRDNPDLDKKIIEYPRSSDETTPSSQGGLS